VAVQAAAKLSERLSVALVRYRTDGGFRICYTSKAENGGNCQRAATEIAPMSDKPIAGEWTMALREDYQTLMEKQLNEWKVQTERFKAGAEKIEAHTKIQYEKNLETLRATQADAWENFSKLKNANESVWAEFKANMDKAGGEVKAAVDRMTTQLKQ
jgi:hypothetical protein